MKNGRNISLQIALRMHWNCVFLALSSLVSFCYACDTLQCSLWWLWCLCDTLPCVPCYCPYDTFVPVLLPVKNTACPFYCPCDTLPCEVGSRCTALVSRSELWYGEVVSESVLAIVDFLQHSYNSYNLCFRTHFYMRIIEWLICFALNDSLCTLTNLINC